jgi:flagellin
MAQAAASSVNKEMEISMERLSTGKRINGASDDAAGVAIASRLTSEIRGTNQAIRNAMDAQAMVDTAEGALDEVVNIMQRMRELAVQASNHTNNSTDLANLNTEYQAMAAELTRIEDSTTWAG